MSAAKKYKPMDTTELHENTENIAACLKKAENVAPTAAAASSVGRSAFAAQNMNSASTNGERLPNFSKLGGSHGEIRTASTTSNLLNRMGAIHNSKPGDVKKIVIKNFKGRSRLDLNYLYTA